MILSTAKTRMALASLLNLVGKGLLALADLLVKADRFLCQRSQHLLASVDRWIESERSKP